MEDDIVILLVDDELSLLDQAKIFLEREGNLNVITASSAKEGLELLDDEDIGVIVSDYQMPEMDGLEFLEEIRDNRDIDIPFIMFTGKGREEVAMKALNLGVDRYFQKGGDPGSQFIVLAQAISQEFLHHQTEKKLELTKNSVDKATTGIFWIDPDGKFVYTNRRVEEILGYSEEELRNMYVWEIDIEHEEDEVIRKKHWERLKKKKSEMIERKHETKEGEVFPVEVFRNYIKHGDEELEFAFTKDITERKKADIRMRKTKEKLEKLQQASTDLETCQSKEEIYTHAIEMAEDILEFDWCAINIPEKDRFFTKKASGDYPEEGSLHLLIEDSLAGKAFLKNESYLTPKISESKEASPTSDDYRSGITVPVGKFGVFQAVSSEEDDFDEDDLTMAELLMDHVNEALKRIEARETEEFLHSMLRHDLKNKSNIVQGYLQLVEEHDLEEEVESLIEKAVEANKEETEMIEKVRKLRQIEDAEEEPVDVIQVIEDMVEEKKEMLEDLELNLETDLTSCEIEGGPFLEELFENLVDNSIKHSDGDLVKISIEDKGNEVLSRVEDDGVGIPDEIKDKIFERGFKKGENAGSGLGMYLVKKIVESYDGRIEVKDSELGGAKFEVYLEKV